MHFEVSQRTNLSVNCYGSLSKCLVLSCEFLVLSLGAS